MDNPTRSETTRKKAIKAAFEILGRDGVKGLTFDSLAKESGISKGGLLHQFKTKESVIKALLAAQHEEFERIAEDYLSAHGAAKSEKTLAKQIVTCKAASNQSHSMSRALFAAIVENPDLLQETREFYAQNMKQMKEEAADSELALMRYFAASGLMLNVLLGLAPISKAARERLFNRLNDDDLWQSVMRVEQPKKRAARKT